MGLSRCHLSKLLGTLLGTLLMGLLLALPAMPALAESGYYRFPTIAGDTVVFTAEGDLWSVPVSGGTARRLTTHPALEAQASLSPDGRQVAFVATYDGQSDIYVIPMAGGEPRRLTFEGPRIWLSGWSADGRIVYASDNAIGPSWRFMTRLVDPRDGRTEELPLADAHSAVVGPDDTVFFNRFGLLLTGDNVRGYRGGAMAQLWRWQRGSDAEASRLAADADFNLTRPMLDASGLYAVADVDGVDNLMALGSDGSSRRGLTAHSDFGVRFPALGNGRIVYQHGADLRVYHLAEGRDALIPIALGSDFEQRRERFLLNPLSFATDLALAPDGARVAIAARGRVVTAGLGPLRRIELAIPATARARSVALAPDGKSAYLILDADGRSEIWQLPADGSTGGRALTDDGTVHRWRIALSPDGKTLAHEDKLGRLWLLDIESRRNRVVDESPFEGDGSRGDLAWSADSRWLAFARADSAVLRAQIIVLMVADGEKHTVTSDRYVSSSPAFARDGRWLYFISERQFTATPGAPWGDRNMGPMFDRRDKIYALALQQGLRFPFQPPDELKPAGDDAASDDPGAKSKDQDKDQDENKDKNKSKAQPVKRGPDIAFAGLAQRLFEVPLAAGNFSDLSAHAERLYFLEREAAPGAHATLRSLAIGNDKPQAKTLIDAINGYALSADGQWLAISRPGAPNANLAPGAAPPSDVLLVKASDKLPDDLGDSTLRLADWRLAIEPDLEWQQMFDEAWRMHRAFAFDGNLRGVDWDAVRAQYAPLVKRVAERSELDDLLAQMISEVAILHSQMRSGESRSDPDAPVPAWLGAKLEDSADGVRIARIYRSDPELPSERAPLAQPEVDAADGDRIVAVDGRAVHSLGEVQNALRFKAGQQVLLGIERPGRKAHQSIVVPVPTDRDQLLRYSDWVESNRARIAAASANRIGYLHLRAMGAGDMAGFVREFYANIDREGLIIDVRRNRGGNIDAWVIAALMRRAWAFWQPPRGVPYWNMQQAFRGHLVVLADQLTYSDGETFAAGIKALGLAPVIGMRTAGAGIWLSDRNRLADGGAARIAEFGQFALDGRWLIEGIGVAPDQRVDNLPLATARGGDAQLDAALAELTRRLAAEPVPTLKAEPIPARGRSGHDGSMPR